MYILCENSNDNNTNNTLLRGRGLVGRQAFTPPSQGVGSRQQFLLLTIITIMITIITTPYCTSNLAIMVTIISIIVC